MNIPKSGVWKVGKSLVASAGLLAGIATASLATDLQTILDDQGSNENGAHCHGIPDYYNQYNGASFQYDNTPNSATANILGYGQIYEVADFNFASDAWVEIRNSRTFVKHNDGTWEEVYDTSGFEGAAYPENFIGDSVAPDRTVIDGYTAVRAGSQSSTGQGYNFHFWTDARPGIDPNDTAGVYFEFEARVVGNDAGSALYLADAGVDYYAGDPSGYGPMEGSAGQGRFKFVTQDWRTFTFTAINPNDLAADPPPVQ